MIKQGEGVWYKVLRPGKTTYIGTGGSWPQKTGRWTPRVPEPETCFRGWHLTRRKHLAMWVRAVTGGNPPYVDVFLAEGRGECDTAPNKAAFEQARLVKLVARVWADPANPENWGILPPSEAGQRLRRELARQLREGPQIRKPAKERAGR